MKYDRNLEVEFKVMEQKNLAGGQDEPRWC